MTEALERLALRYGSYQQYGYRVNRFTAPAVKPALWSLQDEEGGYLGIGSQGSVTTRKADAELEAYRRILQDEGETRHCETCNCFA